MNWEDLPIDETRKVIRIEKNPQKAWLQIVGLGRLKLPSKIWDEFENMDVSRDILEAQAWLEEELGKFPDYRGIYLGLDTLNMEAGEGSNVEIGISTSCDPAVFSDEWAYECEQYGESHLIKGLYEVSDCFDNDEKWTREEQRFSEYLIFLGYSGLVCREALTHAELENDYLSMWGFHDGDMFFLNQKMGKINTIVTEIDL